MENAVYVLQNALMTQTWDSVDCLINYVLGKTKEVLCADEIGELMRLAGLQLRADVPLRYFATGENVWDTVARASRI